MRSRAQQRAAEGPVEWLERTMRALVAMDVAELERLRDEVAAAAPVEPQVALESVRRAARLQQSLDGLLRSTEESLRVMSALRAQAVEPWAH